MSNKNHLKKMIAPIVVTLLMVAYYVGLAVLVLQVKPPVYACILAVVIPGALGGVTIGMCIQRLKEIRSGEEDDLSQY